MSTVTAIGEYQSGGWGYCATCGQQWWHTHTCPGRPSITYPFTAMQTWTSAATFTYAPPPPDYAATVLRVQRALLDLLAGEHATSSRDFGRGVAHAVAVLREALTGTIPNEDA